jgi:hypothetical protein
MLHAEIESAFTFDETLAEGDGGSVWLGGIDWLARVTRRPE